MLDSERFSFQLNDGEQLYASILFGNSRLIPSANAFAYSVGSLEKENFSLAF